MSELSRLVVRLEVQADVQKERCSLSGESGTVSLGTISDNASTKAMAGSILNAYMPLDRWVPIAFLFYQVGNNREEPVPGCVKSRSHGFLFSPVFQRWKQYGGPG